MVGHSIQLHIEGNPGDRIANLQVLLAGSGSLSGAPARRWIIAERIVHPFAQLMAQRMDIFDRIGENSSVVVGRYYNGPGRRGGKTGSLVEAKNAATLLREERIVG